MVEITITVHVGCWNLKAVILELSLVEMKCVHDIEIQTKIIFYYVNTLMIHTCQSKKEKNLTNKLTKTHIF